MNYENHTALLDNYSDVPDLPDFMQDTEESIKTKLLASYEESLNPNTELLTREEVLARARAAIGKYEKD